MTYINMYNKLFTKLLLEVILPPGLIINEVLFYSKNDKIKAFFFIILTTLIETYMFYAMTFFNFIDFVFNFTNILKLIFILIFIKTGIDAILGGLKDVTLKNYEYEVSVGSYFTLLMKAISLVAFSPFCLGKFLEIKLVFNNAFLINNAFYILFMYAVLSFLWKMVYFYLSDLKNVTIFGIPLFAIVDIVFGVYILYTSLCVFVGINSNKIGGEIFYLQKIATKIIIALRYYFK